MTHDEIHQQLTDYALGLLPRGKLDLVEAHLGQCSACRSALQVEKEIGQIVQGTLQIAGQSDARRLRALMPQPPQHGRLPWQRAGWQKQLAPLFIIFTLLLGAFASQQLLPSGANLPGFVVTAYASTATSTITPTATAVAEVDDTPPSGVSETGPILAPALASQPPSNTPYPHPTPDIEEGQLFNQ